VAGAPKPCKTQITPEFTITKEGAEAKKHKKNKGHAASSTLDIIMFIGDEKKL
jgi:hypothetical protein